MPIPQAHPSKIRRIVLKLVRRYKYSYTEAARRVNRSFPLANLNRNKVAGIVHRPHATPNGNYLFLYKTRSIDQVPVLLEPRRIAA